MGDDRSPEVSEERTGLVSMTGLIAQRASAAGVTRGGQISLLLFHGRGAQIVTLTEGQRTLIGRASPADVVIPDRSLSRRHAALEVIDGQVWVEDAGSTNGVYLDGKRVERGLVEPWMDLVIGPVSASIQRLGPTEARRFGFFDHDHFQLELDAEAVRARRFGRELTLILIHGEGLGGGRVGRWFHRIQEQLRPFDRVALYSPDTVEILLPEMNREQAEGAARTILDFVGEATAAVAVLPEHATSSQELLDVGLRALRRATRARPLQIPPLASAARRARPKGDDEGGPVVHDPAMVQVLDTAQRLASSVIPVLLQGETGSGKEVVAQAIHEGGKRGDAPLICVNCGAIPGQLVESTLFGHEKGAFTGASQRSKGVFESADGGTVLLDEVGELPAPAQAALLRVLESKRFQRVGSTREIEVDVRLVAATHRDLQEMADDGEFRQDLLYRLNAMTLRIPPLRERPGDVEPLAFHFLAQANRDNDRRIRDIGPTALDLLREYSWPGNVRELRNAIERAVVIASLDVIGPGDLPETIQSQMPAIRPDSPSTAELREPSGPIDLRDELARVEADMIRRALREADGNRTRAAAALGLPVRTLTYKLHSLGIDTDG